MSEDRSPWSWHSPTGVYKEALASEDPPRASRGADGYCSGHRTMRVVDHFQPDGSQTIYDYFLCECGYVITKPRVGGRGPSAVDLAGVPPRYRGAAHQQLWNSELEGLLGRHLVILRGGGLDQRTRIAVSRLGTWLTAGSTGKYIEAGAICKATSGVNSLEKTRQIEIMTEAMRITGLLVVAGLSGETLSYKRVPDELLMAVRDRWNSNRPTIVVSGLSLSALRDSVGDAWDWWKLHAVDVGKARE